MASKFDLSSLDLPIKSRSVIVWYHLHACCCVLLAAQSWRQYKTHTDKNESGISNISDEYGDQEYGWTLDMHAKSETYQGQSDIAWLDKKERKIGTKEQVKLPTPQQLQVWALVAVPCEGPAKKSRYISTWQPESQSLWQMLKADIQGNRNNRSSIMAVHITVTSDSKPLLLFAHY